MDQLFLINVELQKPGIGFGFGRHLHFQANVFFVGYFVPVVDRSGGDIKELGDLLIVLPLHLQNPHCHELFMLRPLGLVFNLGR